jgi:hypothetical protein
MFMILVVKMVTELEGVLPKGSVLLCYFFVGKRTQCKEYHKEMFPVYSGKCLSCRAVYNSVEKSGKRFAVEHVETEVAEINQKASVLRVKRFAVEHTETEVAEITVKRLLCCG